MELLLSKVADDRIEIMGAAGIPDALREVVGTGEVKEAMQVSPEAVDELDKAITRAIMGGERHLDYVKFAHPIVIAHGQEKQASEKLPRIKIHDGGLYGLVSLLASPDFTKQAEDKQADAAEDFISGTSGNDLLDALADGKMDGQGMFGFSMPIKLEFANESVKKAFMGLNERYQKKRAKRQEKAAAVVGAIKRVYVDKLKEMAKKL